MADFRRFYGIDLPLSDEGLTQEQWERYAELWARLPAESVTARRLNPDAAWGEAERLLRMLELDVRSLAWMFSEDGKRNVNRPQPVKSPGEVAAAERRKEAALAERGNIASAFGVIE